MAWYEDWFDKDYLELYPHRNEEEAAEQVAALCKWIAPSPDVQILDTACGTGRHVEQFAKRGYTIFGADLSNALLAVAQDRKQSDPQLSCHFIRADIRQPPFSSNSFDVILNLFTSFGYFETDEENLSLFAVWKRLLKPNGILVLDYLNKSYIMDTLVPESTQELTNGTVYQRRSIADNGSHIIKDITIEKEDATSPLHFREVVRMFSPSEIISQLKYQGFTIQSTFGDFDGSPHSDESPRLIVMGIR